MYRRWSWCVDRTSQKTSAPAGRPIIPAPAEIKSEQGLLTGDFDLLPIQHWFFDRMKAGDFTNPNHWNQSFLVKVEALGLKKLSLTVPKLIKQHDILRARFYIDQKGNWQQAYQKKRKKWQRSGRVKKDGEEIRKELSTPSPIINL